VKAFRVIAFVLFAFLYLPLLVVIAESFNASPLGTTWNGWTLRWYQAALSNANALSALKMTLLLASSSTAIATLI
jgi:spermidine/putrescine transport system permease protein